VGDAARDRHSIELVESAKGSLHCTQAVMMMVVATLTHEHMTWDEAERETGYVSGRETWGYEMLLSLAKRGICSHTIEIIDPRLMAQDPMAAVRALNEPPEIVQGIIDGSDLALEASRARRCLESEDIAFEVRAPKVDDVLAALRRNRLALVSVDFSVLHGGGPYEAHLVLVSGGNGSEVIIQDPGPPGRGNWTIPVSLFARALHSPEPTSGSVTYVWLGERG
jgi:hypothetical protein